MNDSTSSNNNRILIIVGAAVAVLALIVCVALAGYAIGRAVAPPENTAELLPDAAEPPNQNVAGETAVSPENQPAEAAPGTENNPQNEPAAQPDTPAPPATEPPAEETTVPVDIDNLNLDLFYEVWGIVERDFDGSLPPEEDLMDALIMGSLETLDDDYTRYIPPEIAARLREDMGGSVEGIGAFVRENEEGFIEIVRPIDGQPADEAGLLPGDIVIAVDGEDIIGQSLDEVILKVRGPKGTAVTLTIAREGEPEPLEFTIIRTRFEIPIIETNYFEEENIGYVRLTEFNRNAESLLTEAVAELMAKNPDGIIFDLRDNPGGFLDQSIAVADLFLPEGVVLYERNNQGLDETFTAETGDMAESIPMVVLVNAGSASASEIVAGAIQDNGRAILIGETTFGKGSVQTVHTLSNGAELRVTIARWYTPNNNSIDKQGITPDIEVESPLDLGGEDDTQLQRAIEYLTTGQ